MSDEVNLECEGTDIKWLRDTTGITGDDCSDLNPDFSTAAGSTATDCTLVMQGQYGPFTCFDDPDNVEAAVIVIGQ